VLGNHLNYFCIKPRSMDAQVLSRLFHAKIIQSTTAITSIVLKDIKRRFCDSHENFIKSQNLIIRHCEKMRSIFVAIHTLDSAIFACDSVKFLCKILCFLTFSALDSTIRQIPQISQNLHYFHFFHRKYLF
ncbi:hypothetical protein, partial [Helicobacter sp. 23-1045]